MKKHFFILALPITLFLLQGCQQESNFLSPVDYPQAAGKVWVDFQAGNTLHKSVVVHQTVDGTEGGVITISDNNIEASLFIPAGAFSGTVNFKVKINDTHAYIDFSPAAEFDIPLIFNCTISGLNLTDEQVTFGYLGNDGIEEAEYTSVNADSEAGTLSVTGAKIDHFSRYGWAK